MEQNYQGIGIRAVAQIVDGIVAFILFILVGAAYTGSLTFSLTGSEAMIMLLIYGVVVFLYFFALEAMRGQTLGKMVTGIKVVKEDGSPCDASASFKRNLLRIIDALFVYVVGAIFIAQSSKNQRLGDKIANTIVINT